MSATTRFVAAILLWIVVVPGAAPPPTTVPVPQPGPDDPSEPPGTVILRFPLAHENFTLRATVNLGISNLSIDLYGAPRGSIGLGILAG